MTTVYCKLSLDINSDSEVTSSGFENLDKLDMYLVDKIKLAIAKLKTINEEHCPQKRKFAKDPCSICEKNRNANQDAIHALHVLTGCIESPMAQSKQSMTSCQKSQMVTHFIVCCVLWRKTLKFTHISF